MSVSVECKAGVNDNIYFIDNCCVVDITDETGVFDEEKSVEYFVGDKVYFLDWYDEMIGDNLYTKIKFRDEMGRKYSAVESFFVTDDVWEGIKNYFKVFYEKQ